MSHINQFVNVCTHNNAREVKRLLGEGLDVNARNTQGWPGLHLAMYKYNGSTVRLLLEYSNIRLESTDRNNGWTALHCACDRNNVEGVKLYLAHPACTKEIVRLKGVDG
jgi:ankyrin repeat protein